MTPTWFNTETRLASLRWLAGSLDRTPFFSNSEAPGLNGGMDCVHLLNYIYRQCGAIPSLWIPRQTMDHGHHSERSLLIEAFETWPALKARFVRLPECSPADILPGDALCFTAGKVPHHGAVALEGGDIFHTLAPYGAHRMQLRAVIRGEKILGKLAAVYRPTPELRALSSQLAALRRGAGVMISSPKTPQPAADVGNVQARKVATNQQAIPLPYFGGRRELPIIWGQSRVYNVRTAAVTSKVGKSKQVTGYDYYGDLFGLVSCVLNDYIGEIEVNGNAVWVGNISRDVDHPHHSGDIVVAGVGTFRYYWGTPDQPEDDLVLSTCGEDHPRYLDQSYLVAKDVYFGNNNSTPPTIRVTVERAARFAGLTEDRSREGTNPVTALAEVIGDDWYGLARPDLVDVASWAPIAAAQRRDTPVPLEGAPDYEAAMGYISPVVDRVQAAQAFISQVLEHFDGWLRRTGTALEVGQFPHDGVVPGGLVELSYHDFVAAPSFEADDDSAGDVITDAVVVGPDRDNAMEDDPQPASNGATRNRLGEIREKTFRRPWLITTYQRREIAGELVKFFAREEEKCSVTVRRERVVGLRAGDRFILNDAPSGLRAIVRIVQRSDESEGGRVSLSLVAERGLAPLGYLPVPGREPTLADPDLVVIAHARIFQLPILFADYGPAAAVVALAARPAAHVAGFTVHYSRTGASYDEIATVGRWALRATLAAGIAGGDAACTVDAAGTELALLAAQSDAARDDDALLLFCGYEVISIGDVTALGGGQYQLDILRGRRGTAAAAHAGAAECFIIRREDLAVMQHADFPRTASNRYFKLATYTTEEEQVLADALALVFLFDDTAVDSVGALTAMGKAEAIYLAWTLPLLPDGSPDPTIAMVEIWERAHGAAAPVDGDAWDLEILGTGINRGGMVAGTQKDYYARLRDTGNNKGAIVGPATATANAAATGPAGPTGPGLVYVGAYNGANTYYKTAERSDVVLYGGNYYPAANAAKSGLATWGVPGGGDWGAAFANFKAVATELLLAVDATILKTLVMGDGATANAGIIRSAGATGLTAGAGYWLNPRTAGGVPEFRVGDPAKAYLKFDGTRLEAAFGQSTAQLVIETDPTFVGANPPGRMRLGTFTLSADGAKSYLNVTDGTIGVSQGYGFTIGNFLAFGTWYGVQTQNGTASFKKTLSADGYFDSGGLLVVGTRKAAVIAAQTNANTAMVTGDFAGADAIGLAALVAHLNAVDARLNEHGDRINDLRSRLKVTGGHGLIAD